MMGTLRSNSGCMPPNTNVITLVRQVDNGKGCLGTLTLPDGTCLRTMERSATDPAHPCVPAGEYKMVPYDSPRHGETWCLHNPDLQVWAGAAAGHPCPPDSSRPDVWAYCELHSANWARQLLGCIAPGKRASRHPLAVWSSRASMRIVLDVLGRAEHTLKIVDGVGQ